MSCRCDAGFAETSGAWSLKGGSAMVKFSVCTLPLQVAPLCQHFVGVKGGEQRVERLRSGSMKSTHKLAWH